MEPQNNMNPNPAPAPAPASSGSSMGPVIGIIVLLAVVILGGLYFWGERSEKMADEAQDAETSEELNAINMQSPSDDTNSIEADLDATEIENLDAEINAS